MSEKKGHKLFVGGLSQDTDNTSLQEYFKHFGEIEECRIMRDANDKPRGFGFVTFTEKESFDECLERKDHQVDGRSVEVKVAVPRNEVGAGSASAPRPRTRVKKVFLGGLAPDATKEQIVESLEKVCCEGCVADVSIMTEKGTEKPRGFGFAIMKDPQYSMDDPNYDEAAYDMVDKLTRENKFIKIGDRDVEIKGARSQEEMRREEEVSGKGSRSSFQQYPSPHSYGYGRDASMMYPPRNMYSAYYGGGGPYDFFQQRTGRASDYSMAGYGAMYDRTGASAYGYDSGATGGIDYAKFYNYSAMMGSYPQAHSSYGPARSYGDRSSDRGDSKSNFHPYRR